MRCTRVLASWRRPTLPKPCAAHASAGCASTTPIAPTSSAGISCARGRGQGCRASRRKSSRTCSGAARKRPSFSACRRSASSCSRPRSTSDRTRRSREDGMLTSTRRLQALVFLLAAAAPSVAFAQDRHIVLPVGELEPMIRSEPLRIVSAEVSRPTLRGDITLKAEVVFGERPALRVKVRNAEPGAETFNNVPRYEIAAYELQKLLLDEAEYVVPPTALRMVPLEELRAFAPKAKPTFSGADEVLCVVQYWLQDVEPRTDVLDSERFETDAAYARHV